MKLMNKIVGLGLVALVLVILALNVLLVFQPLARPTRDYGDLTFELKFNDFWDYGVVLLELLHVPANIRFQVNLTQHLLDLPNSQYIVYLEFAEVTNHYFYLYIHESCIDFYVDVSDWLDGAWQSGFFKHLPGRIGGYN